ncbi:hypothetical protein TRAPUB_5543 [Trametes pubescens]|uniref:Uncharacterized protein n=1 Tax=Trametes pubescens TaxID=154538 RepID=A0A1M2V8D8_TRAPU|nr:hypothetical protein TRAPUB_5543 [Trametes pubescens]
MDGTSTFFRLNIFYMFNRSLPEPCYTLTDRRVNRFCHAKCWLSGIYHPLYDVVRYCFHCERWFHTACMFEISKQNVVNMLRRDIKWIPTLDRDDIFWWDLVSAPIQRAPLSWLPGVAPFPSSFERYLWVAKYYHYRTGQPPLPNVSAWARRIEFPDLPPGMLREAGKSARYICPDCSRCI